MSRIFASVLTICLLSLPSAAFADAYTFTPPSPDIEVSGPGLSYTFNGTNLTFTDNTTYGDVIVIEDLAGTPCYPSSGVCSVRPDLSFTANASGFTIIGQSALEYGNSSDPTVTYMTGSYIPGSYINQSNVEFGELFTVTADNVAEWTALEELDPSSSGTFPATNMLNDTLALDFHAYEDDGDMEIYTGPAPTPEPATLTLLCAGVAAGALRKRLAHKRG
jgi:hypothetical protein